MGESNWPQRDPRFVSLDDGTAVNLDMLVAARFPQGASPTVEMTFCAPVNVVGQTRVTLTNPVLVKHVAWFIRARSYHLSDERTQSEIAAGRQEGAGAQEQVD